MHLSPDLIITLISLGLLAIVICRLPAAPLSIYDSELGLAGAKTETRDQ